MEYAVVKLGGKQYKIFKGDVIEIDKQLVDKNGEIMFGDVLLWALDGNIKIGNPKLDGVKVRAKVLEQKKGKKIRVAKFKAKVRYRRVMGFRPTLSRLQIVSIDSQKTDNVEKLTKSAGKQSEKRT